MEKKESIQVIREQLKLGPEEAELERWRKDGRTGVRKLLEAYDRKQAARKLERERLERLQDLEREFWERGMDQVAGCDEAGRGPLAGPLVTAAVILPHGIWLPGLTDSKKGHCLPGGKPCMERSWNRRSALPSASWDPGNRPAEQSTSG